MHITLDIQNEKIAEHVLWMLEHFKKDGVEIKLSKGAKEIRYSETPVFTNEYVEENWKELLMKCQSDHDYYKTEKYKEDRGKYLMEKYK